MIGLVNEDVDSRLIQYLIQSPVNDGGQWDMVCLQCLHGLMFFFNYFNALTFKYYLIGH
jgi:hypothetical protein